MNYGFYPYKIRKDSILFRNLTEDEVVKFKKWARDNYTPYDSISGVWHPVIQAECAKINAEAGKKGWQYPVS